MPDDTLEQIAGNHLAALVDFGIKCGSPAIVEAGQWWKQYVEKIQNMDEDRPRLTEVK